MSDKEFFKIPVFLRRRENLRVEDIPDLLGTIDQQHSEIESLRAQLEAQQAVLNGVIDAANENGIDCIASLIDLLPTLTKAQSGEAVGYAHEVILESYGWAKVCYMPHKGTGHIVPLYTSPPAAKVPDKITPEEAVRCNGYNGEDLTEEEANGFADGWNTCRKAMLSAQEGEK